MHTLRTLTFIFITSLALNANASDVKRIDEGHSLFTVLSAFNDARFDLDGYYEVAQKVQYVGSDRACEIVASDTIVNHFQLAVKHYRAFYPDEELPFGQAISDLREFVGVDTEYEQCVEKASDDFEELEVTHYLSIDTGINLRFQFSREL
jgi:hypothetical protein